MKKTSSPCTSEKIQETKESISAIYKKLLENPTQSIESAQDDINYLFDEWCSKEIKKQTKHNLSKLKEISRKNMPEYMKEHESYLQNEVGNINEDMTKNEIIGHALKLLGAQEDDIKKNIINVKKLKNRYKKTELLYAFEWVINNFAVLDLGGNYAWVACLNDVLRDINNMMEVEDIIFVDYLESVRWFDKIQEEIDLPLYLSMKLLS